MSLRASVIIPAYNAVETIDLCLRALNAQSVRKSEYEVIVVDDGSTDGTAERAAQFTGIQVICARHLGAAAARNTGIKRARGSILLFTDADCEPEPHWVEQMLAAFGQRNCAGAKGTYRTRQRNGIARFVQVEYEEKYARMLGMPNIDFVDTYSAGYRRDVFVQNGCFDESLPVDEDQEFSFRLSRNGYRMVFVPGAFVYHRHPTTVTCYVRRKLRIGYWKARVHHRYPEKAWSDAHTPAMLKVQVLLVWAAILALVAAPLAPVFLALVALLGVGFALSTLPLVVFAARRDRVAALIAPFLILCRALALGLGLAAGILGEIARSSVSKRLLDIVGAFAGLVVFAPLMVIIAILIKLDSPGTVLFVQERIGRNGNPFRLFKFRSMVRDAEALLDNVMDRSCVPPPVFKIPHDPRVTRVGRWLRRLSLDELPQLFNVLKGDMSLVGPRPEEARVVALYCEWHKQRLAVKPGMTGPMQIEGRGALSLDDRVRLELDYIERYSLWQDFCLLARTIPAVIRGNGAY